MMVLPLSTDLQFTDVSTNTVDYSQPATTVQVAARANAMVTIPINDDPTAEPSEQFTVSIIGSISENTLITVTILDNDRKLLFHKKSYS